MSNKLEEFVLLCGSCGLRSDQDGKMFFSVKKNYHFCAGAPIITGPRYMICGKCSGTQEETQQIYDSLVGRFK